MAWIPVTEMIGGKAQASFINTDLVASVTAEGTGARLFYTFLKDDDWAFTDVKESMHDIAFMIRNAERDK